MTHTILVVDDDPFMHKVLEQYLTRVGHRIITGCNGLEALDLAARHLPDLIVLDINMPDMDGLTALSRLKDNPATQEIPVIIMTVSSDRITRARSEGRGAARFMHKPFKPAQLLEEIGLLLDGADHSPPQA